MSDVVEDVAMLRADFQETQGELRWHMNRIRQLERQNAKLTQTLNRLRKIHPGRIPLQIIEFVLHDWEMLNRTAEDEHGNSWVGDAESEFLHGVNSWSIDILSRLREGRTILRGPGKPEREEAELKADIERMSEEGIE